MCRQHASISFEWHSSLRTKPCLCTTVNLSVVMCWTISYTSPLATVREPTITSAITFGCIVYSSGNSSSKLLMPVIMNSRSSAVRLGIASCISVPLCHANSWSSVTAISSVFILPVNGCRLVICMLLSL